MPFSNAPLLSCPRLTITVIPHSYDMRAVKVVIIGDLGVEPPWLGAHDRLAACPSLALQITARACFRPRLDCIPFFTMTIITPNLGLSLPTTSRFSSTLIAQAITGYGRARGPLVFLFCLFSVARMLSSSSSTSFSPRRCVPLTANSRSCTSQQEELEEYCLVVVGNNTDFVSTLERRAVSEEAALDFINELVLPLGFHSVAWLHQRMREIGRPDMYSTAIIYLLLSR